MGGRAVEGTGLENRQGCKLLVGSNPTPSASSRLSDPCRVAIATENAGDADEPMPLRIDGHVGDVMVDGEKLLGDGVFIPRNVRLA